MTDMILLEYELVCEDQKIIESTISDSYESINEEVDFSKISTFIKKIFKNIKEFFSKYVDKMYGALSKVNDKMRLYSKATKPQWDKIKKSPVHASGILSIPTDDIRFESVLMNIEERIKMYITDGTELSDSDITNMVKPLSEPIVKKYNTNNPMDKQGISLLDSLLDSRLNADSAKLKQSILKSLNKLESDSLNAIKGNEDKINKVKHALDTFRNECMKLLKILYTQTIICRNQAMSLINSAISNGHKSSVDDNSNKPVVSNKTTGDIKKNFEVIDKQRYENEKAAKDLENNKNEIGNKIKDRHNLAGEIIRDTMDDMKKCDAEMKNIRSKNNKDLDEMLKDLNNLLD